MSQTPQTPPGWYPADGGERWWDGTAWSEHRRPAPVPVPQPGYGTGQPPGYAAGYPAAGSPYAPAVPPRKSNTTRNVLIVIGVLFVLLVGGCFAVVGLAGKAVNDAVDEATAKDQAPGGPDNPLPIKVGEVFVVSGFSYAAGWTVAGDSLGDLDVQGLKVTTTGKLLTVRSSRSTSFRAPNGSRWPTAARARSGSGRR